jgi:DNA-binding transcriptional ArsR family regulator
MREASGRAPGEQGRARSVSDLADPRALRALAHPIRLRLLGLLRTEGPLTATRAGELLGESSASSSFHLRQLAKYGLAEEAGGGQGRERPWQATTMFTNVAQVADSPEFAAAAGLFRSVVAEQYFGTLMRWIEASPDEPADWQQAALSSDHILYLTPGELTDLGRKVAALLDDYLDRTASPRLRPSGSRAVNVIQLAVPLVDRPSGRLGGTADGGGQ